MLLPFTDSLIETSKGDRELCALADRHYSRGKVGATQFMPPGRTLVLRDTVGLIVFGWLWCYDGLRFDRQNGFCCTIFRNETTRRSSDIILEAEAAAAARWGANRMFTYVDPTAIQSANPGYCFKMAGWKHCGYSQSGLHLLVKTPKKAL